MEILDIASSVVIIAAIVEVIKRTGKLPKKWTPVTSIVVGVIVGLVAGVANQGWLLQGGVNGFLAGLAASGAYSTVKGVVKK